MRVASFTAGTVGFGDTAQGLAIRRALARRGSRVDFRVFAPPSTAAFPAAAREGVHVVDVDAAALSDPARAATTALHQAITAFAPDLVIARHFWAPLHHLIPLWNVPVWLLLRKAPPQWTQGFPGMAFDPTRFARIVAIEPIDLAHVRELIDPLVLANADELTPRTGLGTVALHAGMPGEIDALVAASPTPVTTRFDLRDPDAPFPACTVLASADRVVCGAGYNAYWEARWLGYDGRTTFVPFARKIDDQAWRLATCGGIHPKENGADVVARWINAG